MPDGEDRILVDGTNNFSGGMDASRFPWAIAKNQYFRGCNVMIPRTGGGIRQRLAYITQTLDFLGDGKAMELYRSGHIEAEGWYYIGNEEILLASINGHILEFRRASRDRHCARVLNYSDPNSPTAKAWFTKVPNGSILNNGVSNPIEITEGIAKRVSGSKVIGPGREGVYIQNRFFYVTPDRKSVIASDFRKPTSLSNAAATNIWGWYIPDDSENITAIGSQKVMLRDVEGGALIISTNDTIYSIDVRGDRQEWGNIENSGFARIEETIPSIGAVSSYSFESANTNVYFRTQSHGLVDIRQSDSQFRTEQDFDQQSIEVDYWMGRDTPEFLDMCYTRRFGNRIFTTVGPSMDQNGHIYWNGMVSVHPNPNQSNGDPFTRRFEGLWTGVRPWAITVTRSPRRSEMFVHSRDTDGVNRLYRVDNDSQYDIDEQGRKKDIESWIETRSLDFEFLEEAKVPFERYYGVRDIQNQTRVQVSARRDAAGPWISISDLTHKIDPVATNEKGGLLCGCYRTLDRPRINMGSESAINLLSGAPICDMLCRSMQYRFDVKGPFLLEHIITKSTISSWPTSVEEQEETDGYKGQYSYTLPKDYAYSVH